MNHPYLSFNLSTTYKRKLVVGTSFRASDGNGLINKSVKNIEIPPVFNGMKVVELGFRCFCLTDIESVFIPNSIVLIRYAALAICYKLTEVRFEAGGKSLEFQHHVFWESKSIKRIDFPFSVDNIAEVTNFFYQVSLDCFSYEGTHDFSSFVDFFNTVTNVYVSNNYPSSTFAEKSITGRGKTCGVSKEHLETPYKGIAYEIICYGKTACFTRTNRHFCFYIFLIIQS